ncbi:MAG: GatB/YqeY domain-containing protein [bacterium]|nr:GatB/YqeY domain-containing protein [bacterium]
MNIIEQLEADLKQAAIHQDKLRLQTIRLLKSALKNYEIEIGQHLTPQQMLLVLQKEAKKRRDSIEAYKKGKREDLVKEEESELGIINDYLPEQLSEAQLKKIVEKTITELGSKDSSSMGQVIGTVIKKTEGNADGALISRLVKEKLS